jgi:DNA-damage-inducible protein D
MNRKIGATTIGHLLEDERVRKTQLGDRVYYAAADVVAVLADCADPRAEWDDLKEFEPALRRRSVLADLPGAGEAEEVLGLSGVMRLIQAIDSPRAERLRGWLAEVAAQHVREEVDPELAIQRMRQSYKTKGQPRRWIDQRLRSISARHELVSEWYKRGVRESEQFRALTNKLMQAVFGMDVNAYLQAKGLRRNLRDHLSDLELGLLSLAETTAAGLHRERHSQGIEALMRDVEEAGRIIGQTREQIAGAATASPGAHREVAA